MKKYIHVFVIAALCTTGLSTSASAQKFLSDAAKAAKSTEELSRSVENSLYLHTTGPKRFVFPKTVYLSTGPTSISKLSANLERNLAAAQTAEALPPLPETDFQFLSDGIPEKTFLELSAKERDFYEEETTLGFDLLTQVKYALPPVIGASEEALQPVLQNIANNIATIKNDHLRYLLSKALKERNIHVMIQEISQYYSLGMPYEEAAANYTLRHPYKRNLQTIRLLHNPFIAESFKTPVKEFVTKSYIPLEETEAFKKALRELQQEHERLLTQAANTPAVQNQVAYYEKTIADLYTFAKKHGRLPKWNTHSHAEQDLHTRMEFLSLYKRQYNYEPFAEYYEQLKELETTYAPTHRSKAETLQAFESFVKITGLPYPRTSREYSNISWDEECLFDDLQYWRIREGRSMNRAIADIQELHSQPNSSFYR